MDFRRRAAQPYGGNPFPKQIEREDDVTHTQRRARRLGPVTRRAMCTVPGPPGRPPAARGPPPSASNCALAHAAHPCPLVPCVAAAGRARWVCDVCRRGVSGARAARWRCVAHDFDLCEACAGAAGAMPARAGGEPAPAAPAPAAARHAVHPCPLPMAIAVSFAACSVCGVTGRPGAAAAPSWRLCCPAHGFSACEACWGGAEAATARAPPAAGRVFVARGHGAPPLPAPDAPQWAPPGIVSHGSHACELTATLAAPEAWWICDVCRRGSATAARYRCAAHDYDVCEACVSGGGAAVPAAPAHAGEDVRAALAAATAGGFDDAAARVRAALVALRSAADLACAMNAVDEATRTLGALATSAPREAARRVLVGELVAAAREVAAARPSEWRASGAAAALGACLRALP